MHQELADRWSSLVPMLPGSLRGVAGCDAGSLHTSQDLEDELSEQPSLCISGSTG